MIDGAVGFCIITHVCELQDRRGLEQIKVAAIVHDPGLNSKQYDAIERGVRPSCATIEHLPDQHYVDMRHVGLVDRRWLETQTIYQGFSDIEKLRSFQRQLGRNLARFGFPDAFNGSMKEVARRLSRTYGWEDRVGDPAAPKRDGLRKMDLFSAKVREILVYCDRDWNEGEGTVSFVLVLDPQFEVDGEDLCEEFRDLLRERFLPTDGSGPYKLATKDDHSVDPPESIIDVEAATAETLSLAEYREGRRLDLDDASTPDQIAPPV